MLKNGMKMFEFFILKAIHYNIIVVQALDRVYNVTFQASDLYTLHTEHVMVTLYTLSRPSITHNTCNSPVDL
jgi:hypothetical protein